VRRYQDRIFNTVYRMVGRHEDAQDIVQETFVRAYEGLGKFQSNASFYTWLYRIAVNTSLTARRKEHRTPDFVSMDTQLTGLDPVGEARRDRPSAPAETAECRQAVQDAIGRLVPEQRVVVVLKDIEGHSYEAIAKILEVPIGTIRSRLHRARMELRKRLSGWVGHVI